MQRGLLPASLLEPADVKTSKGKKDTVINFSLNNTTHSIYVHAAHLRDLMEALYRLIKMTFLLSSSLLHPPRWDNTTVVSGDIKWIKGNFNKKSKLLLSDKSVFIVERKFFVTYSPVLLPSTENFQWDSPPTRTQATHSPTVSA